MRDIGKRSALCNALLALAVAVLPSVSLYAEGTPTIEVIPAECMISLNFPTLDATIGPQAEIKDARIYFRAEPNQDFYWVQARDEGAGYQAVLPQPSAETTQVVYYMAVMTEDGTLVKGEEYTAEVKGSEEECEDRAAGIFTGENANIVVGSTVENAALVPPGFESVGVVGSIDTAGAVVALGAGGVAAGAAVAAGSMSPAAISGIVVGSLIVAGAVWTAQSEDDEGPASPSSP